MSLLFESIACRDGQLQNLFYHQKRMNKSRKVLHGYDNLLALDGLSVPDGASKGLWKCRVSYNMNIENVEFSPYTPANPKSFKLVRADITYQHKFEDRFELNELFDQRGDADDIIIVRNNQLTDTSFGNIILKAGCKWLTPTNPLLKGTMRGFLLNQGRIIEEDIAANDLNSFESFMMINALNPLEESRSLPIGNIIF